MSVIPPPWPVYPAAGSEGPGWANRINDWAAYIHRRAQYEINVLDVLTAAERTDYLSRAATIDITAKIQALVDQWQGATGGADILFPDGRGRVHGLILRDGVSLVRQGHIPEFARSRGSLSNHGVTFISPPGAVGWTIDTPSTAVYRSFVKGINLLGPGAASSCGGVRHQNARNSGVVGCSVENYAEWAVLQTGGGQSVYAGIHAQNCLLDRTRSIDLTTLPHGVLEVRGNDNWIKGPGEYNPGLVSSFGQPIVTGTCQAGSAAATTLLAASASATNDAYNGYFLEITAGTGAGQVNYVIDYDGATKVATMYRTWLTVPDGTSVYKLTPGRVMAGVIKGSDNWVGQTMWEFGEAGLWVASSSSVVNKVHDATADLNVGPGIVCAGAAEFSNCMSGRNSQAADGQYDEWLLLVEADGTIIGGGSGSPGNQPIQARDGFRSTGSGGAARWTILPKRGGARRGKLLTILDPIYGPTVVGLEGVKLLTSGTVVSMDGYRGGRFSYAAAATVTQFTDVINDWIYVFTANNANVTLADGTWIKLRTGAGTTLVMDATKAVAFYCLAGVLRQISWH